MSLAIYPSPSNHALFVAIYPSPCQVSMVQGTCSMERRHMDRHAATLDLQSPRHREADHMQPASQRTRVLPDPHRMFLPLTICRGADLHSQTTPGGGTGSSCTTEDNCDVSV